MARAVNILTTLPNRVSSLYWLRYLSSRNEYSNELPGKKLVVIAGILSLPIAYFSMQNWLQEYAYRITLHWTQFAFPIGIIIIIAAATISFQIMKTAMTNPAETIKYE